MRTLRTVRLDISALGFECAAWSVRAPAGPKTAALLRVRGVYRPGSAGDDDGRSLRWRVLELCDLERPAALVVDLRELEYTWGDGLAVHPPEPATLLRVIIREDQRAAVAPLVGDEPLRTDFDGALDELDAALAAAPARRPVRPSYHWSEVWADTGAGEEIALLRGAGDGTLELADPGPRQPAYRTFASEDEAQAWLREHGYARVGERRPRS